MAADRKAPRRPVRGVLLMPGAGTDAAHPSLVTMESAIRARLPELAVQRADFPYRAAGRKAPDRAPVLVASVRAHAEAFAAELGCGTESIVIGGRSMGGRMCSMAIADGLATAGLVCVCYPLHPPGKPEALRTAHLPAVGVATLWVSGDRDQFGSPEELTAASTLVRGPFTQVWVPGADHSLRRSEGVVAEAVVGWLVSLMSSSSRRAVSG